MNIMLSAAVRVGLLVSFIVLLVVMFYFATVENSPLPYHHAVDGWNDLILHVGAFGLLTVIALLVMAPSWWLIAIMFGVGCVLELIQYFVPTREVDAWDVGANAFGVLLGATFVFLMRCLLSRLKCWHVSLRE